MKSFLSGGQQITIHHFPPEVSTRTKSPAVLIVHGSGGGGSQFEFFGREFTRLGYHVFIVKYFEKTGHSWVHPQIIEKHFLEWMETLADAVTFALKEPGVDSTRIALLGISLGGYLSLALASQDDRIAAVVDVFGGMPKQLVPFVTRMPPVLILHGEEDPVVPVHEAYDLERLLQNVGATYEMVILPGQGHGFSGMHQLRAAAAVVNFLENHLQRKAA
jgi:carboxymethylenebutenolidase